MKKAPKRYAGGGYVSPTDPKKKKSTTLTPNPNYLSVNQQMAAKGKINQSTANSLDSERSNPRQFTELNSPSYNVPLDKAGEQVGSGRKVETLNTGGKMITNPDGTIEYYDSEGNPITPLPKAKGGTVYKMKKCPMKKGGKIC